jgi:hypothetical protein
MFRVGTGLDSQILAILKLFPRTSFISQNRWVLPVIYGKISKRCNLQVKKNKKQIRK